MKLKIRNIDRMVEYFENMQSIPNLPAVDMNTYGSVLAPVEDDPRHANILTRHPNILIRVEEILHHAATTPCNTTGCLAGHCVLALRDQLTLDDGYQDIPDVASYLLGLGLNERDAVFILDEWPDELYAEYHAAAPAELPLVLAKRLRYLKEHKY